VRQGCLQDCRQDAGAAGFDLGADLANARKRVAGFDQFLAEQVHHFETQFRVLAQKFQHGRTGNDDRLGVRDRLGRQAVG